MSQLKIDEIDTNTLARICGYFFACVKKGAGPTFLTVDGFCFSITVDTRIEDVREVFDFPWNLGGKDHVLKDMKTTVVDMPPEILGGEVFKKIRAMFPEGTVGDVIARGFKRWPQLNEVATAA